MYGKQALSEPLRNGAKLLIDRLEESRQPLHVPIWGGPNTLAQALDHMRKTMSAKKAAALRSRLRVYAISDQDDTGDWIRSTFPDVHYVVSVHGWGNYNMAQWRGIAQDLPGSDYSKVSPP